MVNLPSSDVPPGNFRGKSGVVGHKTLMPISKNEFVLTSGVSRRTLKTRYGPRSCYRDVSTATNA